MQAIFTVMDTDGSGTLDKQEFMGVVEGLTQFTGKTSHSKVARSGLFSSKSSQCASLHCPSLAGLSPFRTQHVRLCCFVHDLGHHRPKTFNLRCLKKPLPLQHSDSLKPHTPSSTQSQLACLRSRSRPPVPVPSVPELFQCTFGPRPGKHCEP